MTQRQRRRLPARRWAKAALRAIKARLPQTREVWLVSIAWHISAVFLFLSLFLYQDFPEISLLALFVAVYVHVLVNRRLADRKLKARGIQEDGKRKRETAKLRQDLTTHLDTTTHALRQDLTTHLDTTTTRKSAEETHTVSSAIAYLTQRIEPETPIWFTRDWAATPALLVTIFDLIIERKPQVVLDLGSGMTTLIAAYALRHNGSGRVIAWEHLPEYVESSDQLLKIHGLQQFGQVLLKPLITLYVQKKRFQWFEHPWELEQSIDFLIVDSPPGATGTKARYPAVPLLKEHLSNEAVIILDDVNRFDESQIAEEWATEFDLEKVETRKQGIKSSFAVLYAHKKISNSGSEHPHHQSSSVVQSIKLRDEPLEA